MSTQQPADQDRHQRSVQDGVTSDALIINVVQLLLAEKRTSLSVLRTGIAVCALPLTLMSVLIATSKFYAVLDTLHFMIPVVVVNILLFILGGYLIIRTLRRMHRYDLEINRLKNSRPILREFMSQD